MLGWYLQVEGWGCCFVQSENPCFGTCTKLGIIKNLSNVGLCLVPVTSHKPFSSTSPFKLAQKLLCACAERGTSRLRAFLTLFQRWYLNVSFDITHLLTLETSGHGSASHPRQVAGRGDSSGTRLSMQRQNWASQVRESRQRLIWQHSFSKWTSKRNMHVLIFPSLPTGRCFRSLLFEPFAEKRASPVGSCRVHPVDYSARTVKSANLRLVFKSREVEREDTWLNPAVNGW